MGRVNRTKARAALNTRHRSTRIHRAARLRAFRSVLKRIEKLPAGFMKKLKWITPQVEHHRCASQSNSHILPGGYLANYASTHGYLPAGNGFPQNLQDMQQTLKNHPLSARKTCIRRRDARKHSLHRPNYMGISPAILLLMMIKIEKVKWKTPFILGSARTSNAIMLQTAMSEDSPRTISVKNIEGIRHALSFLSNLPENFLPTFVQRNSALKKFIRGMETQNTSSTGGHAERPKSNSGIIEQTVNQLQRRGLVRPYLDKLTEVSIGRGAFGVDAQTLMQQVLVDATNIAALTPGPRGSDGPRNDDMMLAEAHEKNMPKLHLDKSRKQVMISLGGSSCNPINLGNVGLPQGLFRDLPNPFLDKPPDRMEINQSHLSQGLPNCIIGQTVPIDLTVEPPQLQLSPEDAALQMGSTRILIQEVFAAAPEFCNHAPCTFNTCEYSAKRSSVSPFRKALMLGGLRGQHITTPYQFRNHIEGMHFFQAATDAKTMRKLELARQPAEKVLEAEKYRRKVFRYCQALQQSRLAEGHPNNGYGVLYPAVSHEEILSLEIELTENDKNRARYMLMAAIARHTSERRQMLEDHDTQTLFPELQPIQHEFGEKRASEPLPVRNEPIKVPKETVVEDHRSKVSQSGRGPTRHHEPIKVPTETVAEGNCHKTRQSGSGPKRHQAVPEKKPRPQYSNDGLAIRGSLDAASPAFHPRSSSQMFTSSESDVFVECEEISLVRSSPPKEAAETHPGMDSDEVVLRKQFGAGPVYAAQNSKLYSTYSSGTPRNSVRSMYSTKTNQANEKPTAGFSKEVAFSNLTITDMLPNRMSDTGLFLETSAQAAMSNDSISVSGSPFVPLSLASELMVADDRACPKCDKKYKYKRPLQKHIELCEGPNIPEEYPLSNHPCPTCGKTYKKIGNLHTHMDSCNSEKSGSQATGVPKQGIEDEKTRESLVAFPRDNARSLSGNPFCEACRSKFASKKELAKHLKSECMIPRAQGSYGRTSRKKSGTSLALSFKEPMSASDFEGSDAESLNETPSSFTARPGKYNQNLVRAERQIAKSNVSGTDCGVRKGSLAEKLELTYGPQSKYHTPTGMTLNASSSMMENSTLDDYSGANGVRNCYNSDMDMSPTPGPKPYQAGNRFKLGSSMSSKRRLAMTDMSPGIELNAGGETLVSVSRVLVLEPGLSELHDAKNQPTSRKLFSHAFSMADVLSPLPKSHGQKVSEGFNMEFSPLPTCRPAGKSSVTHRKRLSEGLAMYHNKPKLSELEISGVRMGNDTGKKRELEFEASDEKPTKRPRGWNLRKENRKENRKKLDSAATPDKLDMSSSRFEW